MSLTQNNCKYADYFTDIETNEPRDYTCHRYPLESGFCKFHDENFLKGNESDVKNLFENEVKIATDTQTELLCFGFHLPDITLHKLQFQKPVYFINIKFHGDVSIYNSTFISANFSKSEFLQKSSFENLTFNTNFIFSDVESHVEDMNFRNTTFNQQSSFTRLKCNNITFDSCNFFKTNFRGAEFNVNSKFTQTNFFMQTDFSNVRFSGKTIFINSMFANNTTFQFSKFQNTQFHNIDFKEQPLVIFDGNLSEISFRDTDITRIKFAEKIIWGNDDKFEIWDARELVKNPKNFGLSSVLSTYRNLRENYEFRLMYEEAGQFFVREMDLKRKYYEDPNDNYNTKTRPFYYRYFSLTSFYSYLSRYGESFKRTLFWVGLIFLASTVYNWFYPDLHTIMKNYSLENLDQASEMISSCLPKLKITLERTLSSFFQIESNGLGDYLVRISSIPVLGALFIVLKRRFERRFRH
jgi:uncharacterized protein YjbI with pentapeptide repeats